MPEVRLDSMEIIEVDNVNICPYCGSEETGTENTTFASFEQCYDCGREYQIW